MAHGNPPRPDSKCIHCGSLERHRFIWLLITTATDLFDGTDRKVLHLAPERCLEPLLRARLGAGYVTGDLARTDVDVILDVTDLRLPSTSFDVIICSHVLEHVPDDRKAMRELHRVMAADGWGLVVVPVRARQTMEAPEVVDPEERLRRFGQRDHVRLYGLDVVDRLRDAGFDVATHRASDHFDSRQIIRWGLQPASRPVFLVRKQQPALET